MSVFPDYSGLVLFEAISSNSTGDHGVTLLGFERHIWAFGIAAVFALGAIIWSFIGIYLHYNSSDMPPHTKIRSHTIKILFMVPVYAATSWLGLVQKEYALYWDVLRETYEAITIYYFFALLVAFCGGKNVLISKLATKSQQEHVWPMQYCMKPWVMGYELYRYCKIGVLQYVIVRIACAIVTFALSYFDLYGEGEFHFINGYIYVAFSQNLSQIIAMYCLVLFYLVICEDVESIKPMKKFLCIKAVVFFTFWQAIAIDGLVYISLIHETDTYTAEQAGVGLQNFVICIEMFFAAWAHWVSFPVGELIIDPSIRDRDVVGVIDESGNLELPSFGATSLAYKSQDISDTPRWFSNIDV